MPTYSDRHFQSFSNILHELILFFSKQIASSIDYKNGKKRPQETFFVKSGGLRM
jgi:hypothetical protein